MSSTSNNRSEQVAGPNPHNGGGPSSIPEDLNDAVSQLCIDDNGDENQGGNHVVAYQPQNGQGDQNEIIQPEQSAVDHGDQAKPQDEKRSYVKNLPHYQGKKYSWNDNWGNHYQRIITCFDSYPEGSISGNQKMPYLLDSLDDEMRAHAKALQEGRELPPSTKQFIYWKQSVTSSQTTAMQCLGTLNSCQ